MSKKIKETTEDPTREKIVLEFATKMVVLVIKNFDTDVDVDEICSIQVHNIIGEIVTFPVIFNRIGNLKADQEALLAYAKMDFQIFIAQKQEKMRKKLTFETVDSKGKPKMERPTVSEIENAVLITSEYRIKKTNVINLEKNAAYVDSLYWAAKDKSAKLNVMSAKIKPEDFEKEIVEGVFNGIQIIVKAKSIS